jgi:signal transduction histidine kinase/CheY-like chemotaxis protein
MAVPLKVEDRILGVLSVNNFKTDRTLTGSDQNLLATVANQLAIAVDNAMAYRQIEQLNISLEEKVWQRTEALQLEQQRLREVNIQLEAATRHKTQFLANMSHELRTPLNSIIGFSEVLLEEMFGQLNDKQKEYVDDIFTSGKYLLDLINDILDLSKIEAGKVELEPEVLDLRKLLQGSLVMVKEHALAHGIALQMDIADDLGPVIGDEQKIKQILFNLLSNAVKFTPDRGNVGIRAKKVHQAVQISVWDTGIGIAPEDQQRIFEEFQQVGKGLTGKTEGTGLGLTLSKKFVELHGGAIWVESTPDQGSTFSFTLPFEGMASHLPLTVGQDEFAQEPMDAAVPEGPLVLVIEDDPKAINLLKIYLTEGGYRVAIAGDGAEGLEKVRRLSPSVVILDVLLPKVDGWTFLTKAKADPDIKDVPVIILSIVEQKGKGFALGAADYLVKPVKKKELFRKLRDLSLV